MPIAVSKAIGSRERGKETQRGEYKLKEEDVVSFFPSRALSPTASLPDSSVAPVFSYKSYYYIIQCEKSVITVCYNKS